MLNFAFAKCQSKTILNRLLQKRVENKIGVNMYKTILINTKADGGCHPLSAFYIFYKNGLLSRTSFNGLDVLI